MSFQFNTDNKIFTFFDKLVNCFYISLLWLLFCIPVVTIGASTTALYYTVNKVLHHGRSYVWREFTGAFKKNFKQSTLAWLIVLVAGIILGADCYIMYAYDQAGIAIGKGFVIFAAFLIVIALWTIYLFPYIARFENSLRLVLKNSALIAVANFPKTLLMALIVVVSVVICVFFWFLIAIIPALSMWFIAIIMEGVFRKYMSAEDKAKEDEINGEYHKD